MGCESNSHNATPPSPGIAPGVEQIDPATFAREYATDARLSSTIPGFDAPFVQAGLAGYSDAAMRIVARRHGCPLCVTEALLDRTLLAGGRGFAKADLGELHDNVPGGEEDHPLVGQIMGSDPDEMAAAAVKMIEQGSRPPTHYRTMAYSDRASDVSAERASWNAQLGFSAIDVNLACPVKKISKKARGGHWLAHPDGAIDILSAVREALPREIPTTVKMRRAFDEPPEFERAFFRIFDAAYELGYSWATVHARTVQQKYIGPSRWTFLRDLVRSRPDRVILGSGDIWTADDIFRMLAYTGVSAVSVARGCIGNPWIFRQARDMMRGLPARAPTIDEQRDALIQHFDLSVAVNGENLAGRLMRKFGIRFAEHHPRAEEVRKRFIAISTQADWRAVIDDFYREPVETLADAQ